MYPNELANLARIRCPRGCDVRFIQYLYHEGFGPEEMVQLTLTEPVVEKVWVGALLNWKLGLRCGDCGLRYGKADVPDVVKASLDRLHSENRQAIRKFIDDLDDSQLRARAQSDLEEGIH